MSPPLSKTDLDEVARLVAKVVDAKLDARLEPVRKRLDSHSGEYRELAPALRREVSESKVGLEDRAMGFERFMRDVVGRLETKVDRVVETVPPAAIAAKGAEDAAVAGAQASLRVEGKTAAVQVAANRADTNSLAARINSNRALIVAIVGVLGQVVQAVLHRVFP